VTAAAEAPTADELRDKAGDLFRAQHPRALGTRGYESPVRPNEQLLGSVPMSRGRILAVSALEGRGSMGPIYALRHWNVDPNGRFAPTAYGITATAEQLPYLAEAIAKAIDHEMRRWESLPARSDGGTPTAASAAGTHETFKNGERA
jgi:hypothetical protein